ncbi:MAG: hypothetical protein H6922_04930 [Pseudomonadaceae bacterium]|nr:hypothetical protein [Pseudomonadaceae bacterium]
MKNTKTNNIIQKAHQKLTENPLFYLEHEWLLIDAGITCDESRYKRLTKALHAVCKTIDIRPSKDNKNTLKTLLLSLSSCLQDNRLLALAYPHMKKSIQRFNKKNAPLKLSQNLPKIAEALELAGYVTIASGNPKVNGKFPDMPQYNRLLLTEHFVTDILLPYGLPSLPKRLTMKRDFMEVRIAETADEKYGKDKEPPKCIPLDEFDTKEERTIRKATKVFLNEYNDMLLKTRITLAKGALKESYNKYVTRLFCRESLECGGRFYRGFWQNMKSGKRGESPSRKDILINGEPTVELDFQALHINMLYALAGAEPLQEDPYTGIGDYPREMVKPCSCRSLLTSRLIPASTLSFMPLS